MRPHTIRYVSWKEFEELELQLAATERLVARGTAQPNLVLFRKREVVVPVDENLLIDIGL